MSGKLASVVLIALSCALAGTAQAQKADSSEAPSTGAMHALVIGNNDYFRLTRLDNAMRDANAVADKLRGLGFKVVSRENLDRREMLEELRAFARNLAAEPNAIGVFYFAGHGVQVRQHNYLVGVEAPLQSEDAVPDEAVAADRVVFEMAQAKNILNVVILDSCRDNPFAPTRSIKLGQARPTRPPAIVSEFAPITVPAGARGFLIALAASPGQRAFDGPAGGHGLFTEALLRHIDRPGMPVNEVFVHTMNAVQERSRGKQLPWLSHSALGRISFRPAANAAANAAASAGPPVPPPVHNRHSQEATDWNKVKDTKAEGQIEWFLREHPTGVYAEDAKRRLANLRAERLDMLFWESVKDSTDATAYEAYLAKFPRGLFVKPAEQRLLQLRAAAGPSAAVARQAQLEPTPESAPASRSAGESFATLPPGALASTRPAPPTSSAVAARPAAEAPMQIAAPAPGVQPAPPRASDGAWTGRIDRDTVDPEEAHICRPATAEFKVEAGRIVGGSLTLDDARKFDLDLSVKSGARVSAQGSIPSAEAFSDLVIRLYDAIDSNFASYRFQGRIEGDRLAGDWRGDGMRCRGRFSFARANR
jgi:hypothetical protein